MKELKEADKKTTRKRPVEGKDVNDPPPKKVYHQRRLTEFGAPKTLSSGFVIKMKSLTSRAIAQKGLVLGHFSDPSISSLFEEIWKYFKRNPAETKQFLVSRRQQKIEIFARSEQIRSFIRAISNKLSNNGCLHVCFDHKQVNDKTGDYASHVLGIQLILISKDGKRFPYLMGLEATNAKSADDTACCVMKYLEVSFI